MMQNLQRRLRLSICTAVLAMVVGDGASAQDAAASDPYEAGNRSIFDFNMALDKAVLLPAAKFYSRAVPERARTGVHNVLGNLNEPVVFSNQLLQAHWENAGITLARFAVNSSFGVGGLVDVGSRVGLPSQDTDFGITLGVWGAGEGPYLMLPLLGPAPPRDLGGMVVDNFLDPVTYADFRSRNYYLLGRSAFKILDMRSRNIDSMAEIERTSLDYYAATRSLYLQYREAKVRGGEQPDAATPDDPAPPAAPAPEPSPGP